jgi:hypothetical protein
MKRLILFCSQRTKKEYAIGMVNIKFVVIDGIYVIGKQFPFFNYGIIIHKSQELNL